MLVETFVERERFSGMSYRAGELCGDWSDGGVGEKGAGDFSQDGLCLRLPGEASQGTSPGVYSVASGLL